MLVDMHCHIDLFPNPRDLVLKCSEYDLFVLSVTTTPKAWHGTKALEMGNKNIKTALGFHPQLVNEREKEITLFEHLFGETQFIGEIGLDGSKGYKDHLGTQLKIFRHILCLAREAGGKILSIHSRGCAGLVLDELDGKEGLPIMHWFSGTKGQLLEAIDKGCWFSVGPEQLSTKKGKELFKLIPHNRVLSETDGPFIQLINRAVFPWDVKSVVTQIGEIWDCSEEAVTNQISQNLDTLQVFPRR